MIEVWAQLLLCDHDCSRIQAFFVREAGIDPAYIIRRMHVTVYHARGSRMGLEKISEPADIVLPAAQTRFMVLIPGGENAREDVEPGEKKVGVRIQRSAAAYAQVLAYRERFIGLETEDLLGHRRPTSPKKNAFGPRFFQPHMGILREGNGIARDLKPIGELFRAQLGDLRFTKYHIDVGEKLLDR